MLLFLMLWMIVMGFHDGIPLADSVAYFVRELIGDDCLYVKCGPEGGMDPLVAAATAVPYWGAIKLLLSLINEAAKEWAPFVNDDED